MQQDNKLEPTNSEILTSVNELSSTVNEVLSAINVFADNTEKRFERLEADVSGLKADMVSVKSTMVTKDYLDEKLADLRGDLVVLTRKEDHKVVALVEELLRTGVLAKDAAKRILTMEPFPNLAYTLGINS